MKSSPHDLSVSLLQITYLPWLWQIIFLLATDKSWYFAQSACTTWGLGIDLLVPGSIHWQIHTTFSAATLALELLSDCWIVGPLFKRWNVKIYVVQEVDAIREIPSDHGQLEWHGRGLGNWYNWSNSNSCTLMGLHRVTGTKRFVSVSSVLPYYKKSAQENYL